MKKIFNGSGLSSPRRITRTINDKQVVENLDPYIVNAELVNAVNLAILLKRPLLLKGEPGCGKSRLAEAVAYELHHKEDNNGKIVQDYQDLYEEWNIKSTSKAQDGLYFYDAIERLGDSQIAGKDLNKAKYVRKQEMGLAFKKSVSEDKRAVLLIDEIDKADIDFPNDLLNELDKGKFTIRETKETIVAPIKPIVFITSNDEKELPDAFLRRCLFHYIKPLDKDILTDIIERRFYTDLKPNTKLITKAVDQFLIIREELKQSKQTVGKNVSTSELLDWFEAIKHYQAIKENTTDLTAKEKIQLKHLIGELDKLGDGVKSIPFQQVLFKNWSTVINFDKTDEKK